MFNIKKKSQSPVYKQIEDYILNNYNAQKQKLQYFDNYQVKKKSPRNKDSSLNYRTKSNIKEINYCCNHPQKKGKYSEIVNNKTKYLCSKCAIRLASKNHIIYELQDQYDENSINYQNKSQRSFQDIKSDKKDMSQATQLFQKEYQLIDFNIDQFLQDLDNIQQKTSTFKTQVQQKQIQIEQSCLQQYKNIDKAYKEAILSIENQKKKLQLQLKEQLNLNYNNLKQLKQQCSQNSANMQLISTDIKNNKLNIMQNLQKDELKKIIHNYQQNLNKYQLFTDNIKNITLQQDKIQINKIPDLFDKQIENISILQNNNVNVSFQNNQFLEFFKNSPKENIKPNIKQKIYAEKSLSPRYKML